MIVSTTFAKMDVAVFGLARSGVASVKSLVEGGARVFAWDDKEENRAAAKKEGAIIQPFAEWPWTRIKALMLSPGVPLTHPVPHDVVVAAKNADALGSLEHDENWVKVKKPAVLPWTDDYSNMLAILRWRI